MRETSRHLGAWLAGAVAAGQLLWPHVVHSVETTGEIALASQLTDRGLASTSAVPILQGAASWNWPQTWSLGLSAGVDLHSSSASLAEVSARASRYWSFPDDWQMQLSLLYYDYLDNTHAKFSDRAEIGTYWTYRDVVTFGLAGARFFGARSSELQPAGDINFHWPLSPHVSFTAGVGFARYPFVTYYRSSRYHGTEADRLSYYRYGQAGLAGNWGAWQVEIDRVATDGVPPYQSRDLRTAPWLVTISRSLK